jgi:hypothetical protein
VVVAASARVGQESVVLGLAAMLVCTLYSQQLSLSDISTLYTFTKCYIARKSRYIETVAIVKMRDLFHLME